MRLRLVPVAILPLLLGCGIVSGDRPLPPAPDALLPPCPSAPNCVSSESPDESHRVEPLAFEGPPAAAMARLTEAIAAMPRAKVLRANEREIQADFTSLVFRFVDGVQCRMDARAGVIQIRSASHAGYYDFGANGRRVEAIREAFEAKR